LQIDEKNQQEVKDARPHENFSPDDEKLFLMEEVYSHELEERGLFEWALRTRKKSKH
jgi:hypothetical protein